jgi:hypothetical protein
MTRPAVDPLAVRLHREWKPYTHTARPMRPSVRQQMFTHRIQPMDQPRNRAWFWLQWGIMGVCLAYAIDLWVVK